MAQDLPVPGKCPDPPDFLSVLHVDDEVTFLEVSRIYLERRGITVTSATSVQDAFSLLDRSSFDVILSDYQMPVTDGLTFLKKLRERECTIPFILFTNKMSADVLIEAINHGATFSLNKGGEPRSQFADLEQKIREASRWHKAETRKRALSALQ